MDVLVKDIDPALIRTQREWLFSQDMTPEREGLIALCDHISDEMEGIEWYDHTTTRIWSAG